MPSSSCTSACHLLAGNERFVENSKYARERAPLIHTQEPCSCIICCSDSRVPPEVVFDQLNLGAVFVVRTAGHTLDECAIESIRYAVDVLKVRQVIVLGHQNCGAVAAVYDQLVVEKRKQCETPCLCRHIGPALVNHSKKSREANINASIKSNVQHTVRIVLEHVDVDPTIVHGAYYHLKTGKVRWLCDHRKNAKLRKKTQKKRNSDSAKPSTKPKPSTSTSNKQSSRDKAREERKAGRGKPKKPTQKQTMKQSRKHK